MRDDDFCAFRGIAICGKGNGWVDVDVLWCWRVIVTSCEVRWAMEDWSSSNSSMHVLGDIASIK
jgi:hypothetical protein